MNQAEKILDRSRERLSPEPGRVFHRTGRHLAQTARHSREAGATLHSTRSSFRSVPPRPPAKSRGSHQSLPVRFKLSRFGRQLFSVRSKTSSVRSISTEPGNPKKRYQDLTKPNRTVPFYGTDDRKNSFGPVKMDRTGRVEDRTGTVGDRTGTL